MLFNVLKVCGTLFVPSLNKLLVAASSVVTHRKKKKKKNSPGGAKSLFETIL